MQSTTIRSCTAYFTVTFTSIDDNDLLSPAICRLQKLYTLIAKYTSYILGRSSDYTFETYDQDISTQPDTATINSAAAINLLDSDFVPAPLRRQKNNLHLKEVRNLHPCLQKLLRCQW